MATKAKKSQIEEYDYLPIEKKIEERSRLDVNDLIKRRSDELKSEKKTNIYILSGVLALGVAVLSILSL
jgi:hypothetical protein